MIDRILLGVATLSLLAMGVASAQANPTVPSAEHSQAVRDLDAFLDEVHTLTADFKQRIRGADGKLVKQASGSMALARPDRFRWIYETPYKQLVIADGTTLWVYDVGLQQVTRAPLDETAPSSPAMLLSGDEAVRKRFSIADTFQRDGLAWIKLVPKFANAQFRFVTIGFDGSAPKVLKFMGSLNQLTVIKFDNVVLNPRLDKKHFKFDPPSGVDVIGGPG